MEKNVDGSRWQPISGSAFGLSQRGRAIAISLRYKKRYDKRKSEVDAIIWAAPGASYSEFLSPSIPNGSNTLGNPPQVSILLSAEAPQWCDSLPTFPGGGTCIVLITL
jgi:hypothetical protein